MASNKIIEDALTKQVSESAVNAIVGSLESHLASTTSQPSDLSNSGPSITVSSHSNLVQLQTVGGPTPQTVRPRGSGATTIVRAPSGQLIQIPFRQQNTQNVQLVQVQNSALAAGLRQRVANPGGMIPGTLPTSINSANAANLTRVMAPGQPGGTQTLVIGNQQVRLSQPTLVQAGPGVTSVGGAQGNHQLVAVKTENGYQLVRLAAAPSPQQGGSTVVPVSMPQNMAGIRFQTVSAGVRPGGSPMMQQASPQPGQQSQMQQQQLQQTMVGSQPVVVRPGAPSPSNLQCRSPAPVAVVQPQQQPPLTASNGPPPLIQQSRMGVPSNSAPPRAQTPAQSPSPGASQPAPPSPVGSTASTSSTSSGGQMPPDTAKTKCKNFLGTLLRLANEQPETVARNVRSLIQGLVDGRILPEEFTNKLQKELNSSPQPCLVPFLKKSLPYLRHSLAKGEMTIDGVSAPPMSSVTLPQSPGAASPASQPSTPRTAATRPPAPRVTTPAPVPQQQRPMAPPGMIGVRVQMQHQPPHTMSQQGVPGLAHRGSLQAAQQQHDGPGTFNSGQMPQNMGMSQYPGSLKIITPTPLQNNSVPPSAPSPVGNTGISVQTSSQSSGTMNVSSGLPPLPPMPPAPSPVTSKSKSKAKGGSTTTTTAGGVSSPKPATPKGGKGVVNGGTSGKGNKSTSKDRRPAASSAANASASSGGARNDVDDINDVAAMGGVNLLEESQRILGSTEFIGAIARSCPDEMCLDSEALTTKVAEICLEKGLDAAALASDVLMLISHAGEEMIKTELSKLSHAAQHRMDVFKFNPMYEQCADVRGQIRFLENVEKGEKQRLEEVEREMLIRAARSRAKVEDPEKAKLREKAKELQRAEQEEIRQREANLTALQAIGTRKKPRTETPTAGGSSLPTPSMMSFRPRVKRVNMRDLAFIWENDRNRCRSEELYKLYLK